MKKIIKGRKKKNFYKLLPYIISYSFFLTSCTPIQAEVLTEDVVMQESKQIDEEISFEVQEIMTQELTIEEVASSEEEVGEEMTEEEIIEEQIERKVVALTFDDGPSKYTSELVDILDENNAHATFFLIGVNIPANQDAVVKAYESGNEIAIHTYTHTSFTKMTISEIIDELDKTSNLITDLGVEPVNLVRPPYGSINDEIKNSIDTSFILWSVDTRDWESRNVEAIKEEVYKAISEGDIILFHDVYPTTIEAVRELLPELSEEYEFVSVTKLFERNQKELNEHTNYRHGR